MDNPFLQNGAGNDVSLSELRKCSTCKHAIEPSTNRKVYKRCSQCRAKTRKYKENSKSRHGELTPALADQKLNQPHSTIMEHMQNSKNKKIKRTVTEYVNAPQLYDAVKAAFLATTPYTFFGCHSIVAHDNIDNVARSRQVLTDLRQEVKIPFTKVPVSYIKRGTRVEGIFNCICQSKTIKPTTKSSSQANFNTTCGGFVTVIVDDDLSHPKIAGQKISVTVKH